MYGTVNERIKYYRNQKKLNQTELGAKLGLKCSTYSQMERQGNISVDMALEIAKVLDVDPDLIIYGETNSRPIEITPTKPQTLTAKDTLTVLDIYKNPQKPEPSTEENEYVLNATEETIIDIYRGLPKEKQKKMYDFVNELRER